MTGKKPSLPAMSENVSADKLLKAVFELFLKDLVSMMPCRTWDKVEHKLRCLGRISRSDLDLRRHRSPARHPGTDPQDPLGG